MTYSLHKPNASHLLSACLITLVLIAAFSCKPDTEIKPDLDPTPQRGTVRIGEKDFPTVTIGNQVWTTSNYDGPGGLPYKSGTEKPEYGRYYTFEEVKAIALPSGWRLPTKEDYVTMAESQGVVFSDFRATRQESIKKLASATNWRTILGTNTSGFNAQPAGYSFRNSQPLDGDIAEFWTATGVTFSVQESASAGAHNIMFYDNSDSPEYRFNVRFVKNK